MQESLILISTVHFDFTFGTAVYQVRTKLYQSKGAKLRRAKQSVDYSFTLETRVLNRGQARGGKLIRENTPVELSIR